MDIFELKDYFTLDNTNPWKNTPLENYYALNPAAKGNKAETIVSNILTSMGHKVANRENAGHDRIIDGIKTEIKFALAAERNCDWGCIFNHIGFEKDWDQILLICVNGDGNIRGVTFNKDTFPKNLLNHQQGGSNSTNDDYMVNSTNSKEILFDSNGVVTV